MTNKTVLFTILLDSIGNQFYTQTIEEDPVCEWEGVQWTWGFGKPTE